MKPLKERLEKIEVEESVHIPTLDGKGIAETVRVKVPAWKDPSNGEIYLDETAQEILDKTKARHMGLLSSSRIRQLRERHRLTQARMAQLFQLGEKTWTRWESGRERPSRSMNILLRAFDDGKINMDYLDSLQRSTGRLFVSWKSEDAEDLFRKSLVGWAFGSYANAVLAKAIETRASQHIDSIVEVLRSYDREPEVLPDAAAVMLYRNAFFHESAQRLVEFRTYGGRHARIERRLADEEVTA
ncbi:MAG: helix-turn-helix domain-containing protein [Chthoniobacterales bacterium]